MQNDIILLQETFCTKKLESSFKSSWNGQVLLSLSESSHSRGVAILFRENIKHKILSKYSSDDGRILLVNVQINNTILSCVSVYAPNNEDAKLNFMHSLKSFIFSHSSNTDNILIGGDFNSCLGESDRYPPKNKLSKSDLALNSLLKACKLKDCWQFSNPDLNGYTYYDKKSKTHSRLDYFLMSEKSVLCVLDTTITQPVKNPGVVDHNALKLVLELQSSKKGPGYWKLNNNILTNTDFIEDINSIIENVSGEYMVYKSHQLIWELLKVRIKEFMMQYCKANAMKVKTALIENQKQLDEINQSIQSLQTNMSNNLDTQKSIEDSLIKKGNLENKINTYYKEKARGHCIRAKVKWIQRW